MDFIECVTFWRKICDVLPDFALTVTNTETATICGHPVIPPPYVEYYYPKRKRPGYVCLRLTGVIPKFWENTVRRLVPEGRFLQVMYDSMLEHVNLRAEMEPFDYLAFQLLYDRPEGLSGLGVAQILKVRELLRHSAIKEWMVWYSEYPHSFGFRQCGSIEEREGTALL